MPYSRFDIVFSDQHTQDTLEAVLFQLEGVLDSALEAVHGVPMFDLPSFYINNLHLTQAEHRIVMHHFATQQCAALAELTAWIADWLTETVYPMPDIYCQRMAKAYQQHYAINQEEDFAMPDRWKNIQLPDQKSQDALQAVLFQINSLAEDVTAALKSVQPDFEPPLEWAFGLTQDEGGTIRQHFIFHRDESLDQGTKWLTEWLSDHDHAAQPYEIIRVVKKIQAENKLLDQE